MPLKLLPNGVGAATGPTMVLEQPVGITGDVYFVGPGGLDTNGGKRRNNAFLTTNKAYTTAVQGDTIVYLPDHVETFTSLITVAKAYLTFVSEGLGSHRAKLTNGSATGMFTCTSVGARFMNLTFPASTVAASRRILLSTDRMLFEDCDFTCGAFDNTATLEFSAGALSTIRTTRFVGVDAAAKRPVLISASAEGLILDNVTFDSGGFGWNDPYGTAFTPASGAVVMVGLYMRSLRLLNGSSINIGTGGATTAFISMAIDSGEPLIYAA